MAFSDLVERIGSKIGLKPGGDSMQYILAGTLVLVIVISLISVFFVGGKKNKRGGPSEMKFYCVETEKEFTLDPKDMGHEMMPEMMMEGMGRVKSPYTGENTGVPMTKCPACEKWFVPESLLEEPDSARPMMPMGGSRDRVCPHCGTDIYKWYKARRKKRKK